MFHQVLLVVGVVNEGGNGRGWKHLWRWWHLSVVTAAIWRLSAPLTNIGGHGGSMVVAFHQHLEIQSDTKSN